MVDGFLDSFMKYSLLLTNTSNGEERAIIVPAHLPLEDLSAKIKVEFQLPLCDEGWHRFLSRGTTYVIDEHLISEPEIQSECGLRAGHYSSSEHIRLSSMFTVLGSSVTYIQDKHGFNAYKIRITLQERI